MPSNLPIHSIIPALKLQLSQQHEAILEAAPGAGKTTAVPLAFLDEPWLQGRKIIMLEPRRIAAKLAAKRLADQLDEPLGQRVGYQIRQEGKQSRHTQILVVTEGILTRMLQEDPMLEDIALVIFDEFHERNLQSDLAFSLCLQTRSVFRDEDPLKLLVMSATLDSQRLTELLACEPIVCDGRLHPITYQYDNLALQQKDIIPQVAKQVRRSIQQDSGSILVFLPGQKEIRTTQALLESTLPEQVDVYALYGDLSLSEQEAIIAPAPAGRRKVVLATSIAQTSLTIEGIRVVIDSGLAREARFDPKTATTRLHTRKASSAETTQRAGRAGRLSEGICYRWWSAEQQHRLSAHNAPQIEIEDLSSLVMELARWGAQSYNELDWMSSPPEAHWQQAKQLLIQLGLLESSDTLTLSQLGQTLSTSFLPPRLARLLHEAILDEDLNTFEAVAYLFDEQSNRTRDSSLINAIEYHRAQGNSSRWRKTLNNLVAQLAQPPLRTAATLAMALAKAFPDRIAMRSRQQDQEMIYKLSNGRQAKLAVQDSNAKHDYLVALSIGGHSDKEMDSLYLAHPISFNELESALEDQFQRVERCEWHRQKGGLQGVLETRLGKLLLKQETLTNLPENAVTLATCSYIRQQGLPCLNWDDTALDLRARIRFAHHHLDSTIPNPSDECLLERLEDWLAPFLVGVTRIQQLEKIALHDPLLNLLEWSQQQTLQQLPSRLEVASGSKIKVDYLGDQPVIRVKLQEMFGELKSPMIAGQTVKVELLSPGQRPLAVTQDLAFFWREVYPQVRKEMRGRYPKHPWPEDPFTAEATAKTNRALRNSGT